MDAPKGFGFEEAELAEVTQTPTFDELLNPTLQALHQLGGSASIQEIVSEVIQALALPDEVVERPHTKGNRTQLEYRLAWARTYLKKYGLIDNSERGVWALTAAGHKTKSIDTRAVLQAVRQSLATLQTPTETRDATQEPGEGESWADEEDQAWIDDLLSILLELPPPAFERLCMRMLRESGFIEVEVTGRSGDGGIDRHGIIRLAGLISFNLIFQCKRYRDSVGAGVVRDFRGAMVGRADKGLIITTSSFTREARRKALNAGAVLIDLIDGQLLAHKLKELQLGIGTKVVEEIAIDREWFTNI